MTEPGRGFDRLVEFFETPPHALAEPLAAAARECFTGASSPWGEPWAPQSAATLARRDREGKPPGFAHLADSVRVELTDGGVRVGARFEQARRFHEGGTSQPARPFLPVRDGQVDPTPEMRTMIKGTLGESYRAMVRG